jgi:4-carboxymuconolactone decarboxylase
MTQRLDKGKHWFNEVYGEGKADGLVEMQVGLAQDLARFGIEFNFGDIYSRPGLTLAQRELLSLASLVTIGGLEPQLRGHTRGAIRAG